MEAVSGGTGDDEEQQLQQPAAATAATQPVRRVIPPELPMGWTQMGPVSTDLAPADRIHYPWDVVEEGTAGGIEFPPPDQEMIVVGTAGQKITRMGGDLLAVKCGEDLRQLVLRSHLLTKMDGLGGFKNLKLLELYDNQIEALEGLDDGEDGRPGSTLATLDMSYNVIREMAPVRLCTNLTELYLAQNKIKFISGLKNLTQLRKVDLGANRIRVIPEEELAGLDSLEELWLGKNKIEAIGGLANLTKLKRLDVQANRLTRIENLTAQVDTLEELYLSHNGIDDEGASCETGLALPFSRLTTIDMSRNRMTSARPFAHLLALEDLWLSGNRIENFEAIEPLSALGQRDGACLEGIYLEMNPVADDFEYRKRLASMIPSLTKIDADVIGGNPGGGDRMGQMIARMRELQEAAVQRAKAQEAEQGQELEHTVEGPVDASKNKGS